MPVLIHFTAVFAILLLQLHSSIACAIWFKCYTRDNIKM